MNRRNSVHRNKPNDAPIARLEEMEQKPPSRFRYLVKKHKRTILDEAAQLPALSSEEAMKLYHPHKMNQPDPIFHPKGHHHHDGEECSRKSTWFKIRTLWRSIYQNLGLRHWAFISTIVVYSFIGGIMFSTLEKDNLEKERAHQNLQVHNERAILIDRILDHAPNANRSELDRVLLEYQTNKTLFAKTFPHWDIWDGIFYSFTVYTTIGYGHFYPTTYQGQIATIIYAIIGIPLVLAVLSDFGKLLTRVLKRAYTIVRHAFVHMWQALKYRRLKSKGRDFLISLNEPQEDLHQFDFPLPLALMLIVVWIVACAAIFRLWESEWSYFQAFYFFFISLSTIGLGDLTPNHPKNMLAGSPFILIGLTLLSLIFNLIQNKIDDLKIKAQAILEDQLGLDTISGSECDLETATTGEIVNAETQLPVNTTGSKSDRFAMGVLQTMQLKARRRRIGTQTEDSYIRDTLMVNGQWPPINSVLSTPVHFEFGTQSTSITPMMGSPTLRADTHAENASGHSMPTEYFECEK